MSYRLQFTAVLSYILSLLYSVNAFSFWFTDTPSQCASTTVQWDGGQSPFTLLLVPTGHLNPETRTIIQLDVGNVSSATFLLTFPAQSQFVATMSDATGIGSGGTSIVTTVGPSSNASCLNTKQVEPKFVFFLSPSNVSQCASMNISWESKAEDPVELLVLIPGGQSTEIANITNNSTSLDWQADVPAGTDMLFVAGDKDGLGTGGSTDVMQVANGSSSCLDASSPSSTAGVPVGSISTANSFTGTGTTVSAVTVPSPPGGGGTTVTCPSSASSGIPASQGGHSKHLKAVQIAGILVGVLAFLTLLVGTVIIYRRIPRVSRPYILSDDEQQGTAAASRPGPGPGMSERKAGMMMYGYGESGEPSSFHRIPPLGISGRAMDEQDFFSVPEERPASRPLDDPPTYHSSRDVKPQSQSNASTSRPFIQNMAEIPTRITRDGEDVSQLSQEESEGELVEHIPPPYHRLLASASRRTDTQTSAGSQNIGSNNGQTGSEE